ncbi:pilus assembly protein [Marinobacter sediminicola]|uniref:pilus assembly protein n=1 Tax=Marinobacter sediminicola TaxID=3072994 RepID=UPI00281198FC|nr:PilC/PilY family type IV pilus protein [Marinobacter sp. F26243]
MKIQVSRVATFLCGFILSFGSTTSLADDTEIFFNTQNTTSIRPNLLFILDNSGSMDAEVTVNVPVDPVYNPAKTYPGAGFDSDFVYYKQDNTWYTVRRSVIECADMLNRIDQVGELKSYRMAYYYNNKWNSFNKDNVNNSTTDCQADDDRSSINNWSKFTARNYFSANYRNWQATSGGTVKMTRMDVMKGVARHLADSTTGVNIGLMAFNTRGSADEGGHLLNPVENVATNAGAFKTAVNSLDHDTWTPLAETLFEAMRYYQGGKQFLDSHPIASQKNGYVSPISLECQSNNIILLTDGEPTRDTNHNATMISEIGKSCTGGSNSTRNCLPDIAGYMKNNDMSSAYAGDQTITTYTVGFEINDPLLADTATAGGGKYYQANDAQQLANAFDDIVRSVLDTSSTFVAPGVAVNTFNRLNHFDALYYSVFEPDTRPLWQGNLKRYRISSTGDIVDVNGNQAVDPATGFFKDGAQSWWAQAPDGKAVTAGGVRSKLPAVTNNRKVYTWANGKALTANDNLVTTANTAFITKTLLGDSAMSDAEQLALIRWIRGEDVLDENGDSNTTDARKFVADPLHSEPKLIVYGGTEANPDTAVFFGDNQGYLHAIDGETGESYFAFIPTELLKNQRIFMENSNAVASRIYGMDGSIVSWVKNPSGAVSAADGDHVYLYAGMRRGGRSYYALDVTSKAAPKALWHISGGSGQFAELGETWSTPVKSKINLDGTIKDVLFFAGGYDDNQDSVSTRTKDSVGRALYVVDAKTGARLWWAGPTSSGADLELSQMEYSIPASPKVLDIDGDGLADQVYVGDMGGQIWRFDLNNGEPANSLVHGGRIADFSGSGVADARRFYHTPDLAISRYWGKRYLTMMIGSGYHAHPLNKVINDRAYMLRIPELFGAPVDASGNVKYTTHTESDLLNITDNKIGQGTDAEKLAAEQNLSTKKGWMLHLENSGEKILSSSLVVDGVATFTTYEPAATLSACAPSTGRARLYSVSLRDGRPVRNYDSIGKDSELTKDDRSKDVPIPGIPPSPSLLRIKKNAFICVGTNCEPVADSNTFTQTFWREVE